MGEIAPQVQISILGTVDPSSSPEFFVFKAPAACEAHVLKVYMLHSTDRALAAADINTVTLNRIRAAASTTIGSNSTVTATGTALVDMVPWEIPISSAAYGELNAGDALQLVFTEGAIDLDIAEVSIAVEWVPGTGEGL